MEGLAGNPIKSTHDSMLGNVLPPSLLNGAKEVRDSLSNVLIFLVSPITQGMKNPLPIRFSGTWSQDCNIVLSLSLPLGQYVRCSAPVGLSVHSTICADGLPLSKAVGSASLPDGCPLPYVLGPGWAWAVGQRVSVAQDRKTHAVWP